jgi:beta-galactosidase
MRSHLLAGAGVLAFTFACAAQPPLSNTSRFASSADARQTMPLIDAWRFSLADSNSGAEPAEAAASWSNVSVPHTWNRVGYYLVGHPDRVNTPEITNKVQGVGWYRLTFTAPQRFKGRKAWLQFDAASRTAEVWLNGVRLGEHWGGFSRFRLDASNALKPGEPNLLVVKTDNSRPAVGSTTADTLPLTGDFFVHGGLYRAAALVSTNLVHLDMLDFGGPGVYAQTASLDGRSAQVSVRSKLQNDGPASAKLSLLSRLIDPAGRVAAEQSQALTIPSGDGIEAKQTLTVQTPHLWQGVEDPYLYRLAVEIRDAKGAVLDRLEQPFGIRQMKFDPSTGFLLNGKPLRLHGVGLHQDLEGKGWAMTPSETEADIQTIREMGANTIRLTHYEHGPTVHELADRYGLILWDEIPLVAAWTLAPGQQVASPGLIANARQQLQELIRQNYNHSSVAVWGIANEVDFGNSMPQFLAGGSGEPPDPLPLLDQLKRLAKAEDPGRPTALATCCEGRLFATNIDIPIVAPVADVSGANRYFGWYFGNVKDLGPHLDSLHAARPDQPLAVSEYGAGGAVTQHTDNPLGGPVAAIGRDQPEEYQSYFHENSWAALESRHYLWSTWLWSSFDFATTVRHEGDSDDVNTKGLVTYDRKVKKDAFFFYKANWTNIPTVHINGRRYVERAYRVTDVRVYSNAPTTELRLNGRSLGVQGNCEQMTCIWKGVRLSSGENELVASGRFTQGPSEDRIVWRLAPETAHTVRIDSGALVAAKAASGRYGSDNFFEGGAAGTINKPADYGKPPERKTILGTGDPDVLATYREGDFRYRIPLENGSYDVTLMFVEPGLPAGERQFDVTANGERKVAALDIAAAVGAPLTALNRSFLVHITDGLLDLHFAPIRGSAVVSGLEIKPRQ